MNLVILANSEAPRGKECASLQNAGWSLRVFGCVDPLRKAMVPCGVVVDSMARGGAVR